MLVGSELGNITPFSGNVVSICGPLVQNLEAPRLNLYTSSNSFYKSAMVAL